jgi:D-alanine-D-alanine ligase
MKKINKHIEIVRCGIPRLSSMGLKSCNMIQEVLARHYENVGITYVNNEVDLALLIAKKPDLAFLGFKNLPEDGSTDIHPKMVWIPEVLTANGINYTGSTYSAMELDHNKDAAKEVIALDGLLTAPYFTAEVGEYLEDKDLPLSFPLFVKPPQEGGGTGIDEDSIVTDFSGFKRKVQSIRDVFDTPALVETYLAGREFSVALLETEDGQLLSMPIELTTKQDSRGNRILSRKVKSDDTEDVFPVPAGKLRDRLIALAEDSFRALGARDYGRVDIRMDDKNNMYFLEANLIPGVAKHDFTSYFTSACWINLKMSYESMLLSIVELGLSRNLDTIDFIPEPSILTPTTVLAKI